MPAASTRCKLRAAAAELPQAQNWTAHTWDTYVLLLLLEEEYFYSH